MIELVEAGSYWIKVSDVKKVMAEMVKDYLEEAHEIALSNNKFDVADILVMQSKVK